MSDMLDFSDATLPGDSVPITTDVEYPCEVCGQEAGPYAGRGRKPKRCSVHRKAPATKSSVGKVTGSAATLAAQATGVLVQLNGMIAIGLSAMQMFRTAGAIVENNDMFEARAYAALSTDTELCKMILKTGGKSAKVSLALAYGTMGMAIAPTAMEELKERKAERDARREELENASGA